MADVLLFPPLPPTPQPPAVPLDERQQTYYRIMGCLVEQLVRPVSATYTDTTSGFRASAVDLGVLQDLIEQALSPFDMNRLRDRWEVDVRNWIGHTIVTWIQRCKWVHQDLRETGIHITIEAQDDRGYYQYELDVFPGKGLTS